MSPCVTITTRELFRNLLYSNILLLKRHKQNTRLDSVVKKKHRSIRDNILDIIILLIGITGTYV